MSTLSYEKDYREVQADMYDVQQEDIFLTGVRIPADPMSKNAFFIQFRLSMYLRYLQLARRLTILHNVELQPQKLTDVRTMLDGCIGRMLELKHYLVENCGDYLSLDNLMLDMKLAPTDVEVPIPSYILDDRAEELVDRREVILSLQRAFADSDPDAPVSKAQMLPAMYSDPTKAIPPLPTKKPPPAAPITLAELELEPMSVEEATRVLQVCERGRQARQRAKFQLALFRQQRFASINGDQFSTASGKDRAASIIQTVVLGYLERKRAEKRFEEEELFLGLRPSGVANPEEKDAAARRVMERKARQKMNIMSLRQKTIELEANIKASEGPKNMECMLDEILMHMAYARLENKDGQLVELPSQEEGGSLKLLGKLNTDKGRGKRSSSVKRVSRAVSEGLESNISGARRSSEGHSRSSSVNGEGAPKGQKKGSRKEEEEYADPLPNSAFWSHNTEVKNRYESIWKQKFTNIYLHDGNMDLPCDEQMIRQQLLEGPRGIMNQLRQCVDDLVMMEVANLKERMEWEKKNKRKKGKKKGKDKKAKKPKLKDPTKGVSMVEMMSLVVQENKLQLPPTHINLKKFIGPENVMASSLDQALRNRKPDDDLKKKWSRVLRGWNEQVELSLKISMDKMEALYEKYLPRASWLTSISPAEIKRAVTEYAILPLGSQVIHDMSAHKRTMLFYGYPSSGKTMVSFAICNEAGANLFNLSPGNFPTMKGIVKQIQTVFYLARMKGPSVIYIENVEKIFPGKQKGKKKNDGLAKRGKKMKKDLVKCINSLLPTDRVMVIFVSNEPWLIDKKAIDGVIHHGVFFGLPDYATRVELLRQFEEERLEGRYAGLNREGLQQVALLSEGLTIGQLRSLVETALYPRRVDTIPQRPLTSDDYVVAVSISKAVTKEEQALMNAFHETLPFHLRRANPIEDFPESEEDAKKRKAVKK